MAGVHSARGGVDGIAVDQSLQNRKLQIAAKEQDTAGQSRGQASEAAAGLALADSQRTARGHLPPVRTLSWLQRRTHQQPAAPECLWKADSWTNANRQPGSEKPPLPGLFRACLSRKCPPRKAAFLLHTETNGHLYCMFMVTSTLICEVSIYD